MKKSYFYLVFLMPLFLIALMKLCPAPAAPINSDSFPNQMPANEAWMPDPDETPPPY